MYDMAKKARSAMKAKASRLSSADPHQKVDSSTWTPPEALNTEAKTGLRPISRRAFKSGGSVKGEKAACNMGRKPRKSGGEANKYAIAKINRNVKEANEDRPGVKHVGGMKKGGRAHKQAGGGMPPRSMMERLTDYFRGPPKSKFDENYKDPKGGPSDADKAALNQKFEEVTRKSGGRTKKMDGGPMAGAEAMMRRAQKTAGVPSATLTSVPATSRLSKAAGLKKGGMAHKDEAMDIALIKKMVKPGARKARATGGEVFSGPSYPGKIPGVTGGRIARATGGKTKGKGKGRTNINIVIAAGKPAGGADMMGPPPGMDAGPQGMPIPVPPPQGGAPGAAPMPMPIPMPMPMAGGAPGGASPMPRKRGGRANGGQAPEQTSTQPSSEQPQAPKPRYPTDAEVKAIMDRSVANIAREMGLMPAAKRKSGGRLTDKASSYKDMTAGSGSGEGRLQKTDIAKARMGRKAGGKAYRSYKDMDAGAGSGLGRLEKTEIQARKR